MKPSIVSGLQSAMKQYKDILQNIIAIIVSATVLKTWNNK